MEGFTRILKRILVIREIEFMAAGIVAALTLTLMPSVLREAGMGPREALLTTLVALIAGFLFSNKNIVLHKIRVRDYRVYYDRIGPHQYVPQVIVRNRSVELALNIGGALIPLVISITIITLLAMSDTVFLPASAVVTLLTMIIVYRLARIVDNIGVVVPTLIPAIISSSTSLIIVEALGKPLVYAGPIAYVAGCLGTLIGADILKIKDMIDSGASNISIGGLGSFDGIYIAGLLSVVITLVLQAV